MVRRKFSEHPKAEFWDYYKNILRPDNVSLHSHTKFWFKCNVCNHGFEVALNDVNAGCWCPYCGNKKLCDNNGCILCFDKSFASLDKSKYWYYEKNDNLDPRFVFKCSNKKFWFKCVCAHIFEMQPNSIKSGRWCPYCGSDKLCDDLNCNPCYNKSFASSDKVIYWNYIKNNNDPRFVFKITDKKFWFDCTCGHIFETCPSRINAGSWCPYCNRKKLCYNDKCNLCHDKSFASSDKVIYWDKNKNKISPRVVFKCSNKKYWFICTYNHSFLMAPDNISRGEWCPNCKNKTEQRLFDNFTNYKLLTQARFDWCRGLESNNYLPFDFLIEEHKIIIECDGRQHFQQVSNWRSPEEEQENDKRKMQLANEHGYSVIRILQEDIAGDRINWIAELTTRIEKIIALGEVGNSFIGGDIYNNHRPTFIYNGILVIDDIDWLDYL